MTQPSQGQDLQEGVYRTPMNLLEPINRRWPLCFDLAANASNNVVARLHGRQGLYFTEADNALTKPWSPKNPIIDPKEFCWLNPPYGNLGHWTPYAEAQAKLGARFVMLLPSATGADWLVSHCLHAKIVFLVGRPVFEFINAQDHKNTAKRGLPNTDCYGKDLLLVVFDGTRGVEWWDWRK